MPDSRPQLQSAHHLHASRALLPDGWAENVRIEIDGAGLITAVKPNAPAEGAEIAAGPVVPALPNLHSHAFQRAMAGLAEVSGAGSDSFWTWREEMYRTVGEITPEDAQAIATRLYVDLLKSGFGGDGCGGRENQPNHCEKATQLHGEPPRMNGSIQDRKSVV